MQLMVGIILLASLLWIVLYESICTLNPEGALKISHYTKTINQ